jgi:hypothetical protein
VPDQTQYQIKLSDQESSRLANRVMADYRNALDDHAKRMAKQALFFRRWRCLVDPPKPGDEDKSNYPVPVCKWLASQKWARNADSIFGDDAEITAVPNGPSDYRNDAKIGAYMTWRVFQSMKLTNRLLQFELYKIIFGRVHAYTPWTKKSFDFETTKDGTQTNTYYKGPDFQVMEGDDMVFPAEDAETLHDFTWFVRKVAITPQKLLDGEQAGRYTNIKKNYKQILMQSYNRQKREVEGDQTKRQKDAAEGVQQEGGMSSGSTLLMLEWYGRWRMLKKGQHDADEYDVDKRQLNESDIVFRVLPDMAYLMIGAQDLRKLYPADPFPRPFVEASYVKDGSYWCDGMMALSIDSEDEIRSNHNKGSDALDLVVSPPIGYKPAQGFAPKQFRLRPGDMIPMDNPATDMNQMKFTADLEAVAAKEQVVLSYLERLTGETDQANGRASDRPNAPRTASGQAMLMQAGNLRMTMDTTILREDYALVFQKFWILEFQFGDAETFFRVTEEDADGLFDTGKGGSYLAKAERNGSYDFRLKLATSVWSRAADKENTLARYQLDLQNPLIVQNPAALWKVTNDAHKALGDPDFGDLVPQPPAGDLPLNPKDEWARMQQGEAIEVNPQDNDQLHMVRHMKDLNLAVEDQYADKDAIAALKAHYVDHIHQLEQKKLVQAITERIVQQAAATGANPAASLGTGMGQLPPGVMMPPGGTPITPPMPLAGSVAPPIKPHEFKGAPPPGAKPPPGSGLPPTG